LIFFSFTFDEAGRKGRWGSPRGQAPWEENFDVLLTLANAAEQPLGGDHVRPGSQWPQFSAARVIDSALGGGVAQVGPQTWPYCLGSKAQLM
jgi:hypothetical protein